MTPLVDVPLAPLTTLGLGGPAARLWVASTAEELVEAVTEQPDALLLAGGSNLVLPDEGVPAVVRVASRGVQVAEQGDQVEVTVQAGHPWDELVALTVADGLSGLEALSGIPGSSGATPVQNVGAYGQDVAALVVRVDVLDRTTGRRTVLAPAECGFGYRDSVLKRTGRYVVLSVTFRLARSTRSAPVGYAELADRLGIELGAHASTAQVRQAVLELRRGKGMVLDADDPDTRSAGSFFTNPLLSHAEMDALRARTGGAEPPVFPADGGRLKTSAAWLIQQAGFDRGYGDDHVRISTKHTLALTHPGGGSTAQLLALAREVRDEVQGRFGVCLVPEPTLVGTQL